MAGRIDARLEELGIALPAGTAPVANYVPFVVSGKLVFISGQVSGAGDQKVVGTVGAGLTIEEGREAARLCALNLLAHLKTACGGDLDRVARCVKLGGFVNAPEGFADHPKVINGASDLIVEVFGDAGRHARAAVGVSGLPMNYTVEVEAVFELA